MKFSIVFLSIVLFCSFSEAKQSNLKEDITRLLNDIQVLLKDFEASNSTFLNSSRLHGNRTHDSHRNSSVVPTPVHPPAPVNPPAPNGDGDGDEDDQNQGPVPAPTPATPPSQSVTPPSQPPSRKLISPSPVPPSNGPSSSDDGSSDTPFASQFVQLHNKYRKLHSADDVVWSHDLYQQAKSTSLKCDFNHDGGKTGVGQNFFAASGSSVPSDIANQTASFWYNENVNYNYNDGSCYQGDCGHFTQMVWKSTKRIGCAMNICTKNCPIGGVPKNSPWVKVVCDYDPPGNHNNQYTKEVSRS